MPNAVDVLFISSFYDAAIWDNDLAAGESIGPSVQIDDPEFLRQTIQLDGRRLDIARYLSWVRHGHLGRFEDYESLSMTQLSGSHYESFLSRQGYSVYVANLANVLTLPTLAASVDPRFVLLSSSFFRNLGHGLRAVAAVRAAFPDAVLVLGGQHLSVLTMSKVGTGLADILQLYDADAFVTGIYGETALIEILKRGTRAKLQADPDIPGTFVRIGDRLHVPSVTEDPALSLDDIYVRWQTNIRRERLYPMVNTRTARSCAFACAFCAFPALEGPLNLMSVEAFEKELAEMKATGAIRVLSIIDDTFNVPVPRFKEIVRLLSRYDFEWYSYFRCQFADDATVKAMRDSGCRGVFLGIESADDQVLKNMNKGTTVDKYRKGIELLKKYDISTHANFVVGFPGETPETVAKIPEFLDENGVDYFGTIAWHYESQAPVAKKREEFGIRGPALNWRHNTMTLTQARQHTLELPAMTKQAVFAPAVYAAAAGWTQFLLLANGFSINEVKLVYQAYNRLSGRTVTAAEARQTPEFAPLQAVLTARPMWTPKNI